MLEGRAADRFIVSSAMSFVAPVADQVFAMRANARIADLAKHERFAAASDDMVSAIVEGIGQFANREFAPLRRVGDIQGARAQDGIVTLPGGYAEAYRSFIEQGWNSVAGPAEYGGQGLPFSLACCVLESLGGANLGFSLLPMLTVGAIDALDHHGSDRLKKIYLPRLVSGEWSGTMNLTEPQAGSDVGALRSTATPISDGEHQGKWLIKGTKIFITWGEHDLAENIAHLVLARIPGAPEGSRGISLFVVPKFHVMPDGSLGERNDLRVVSIENKLGIHASPTCVMSFGDHDACIGELVGAENEGLKAMFTMMNSARINVGSQGVQVAEAALQLASNYARERIQSARAGAADKRPVAIVEHPDVRRVLLRMRALTEGGRALLYYTAGQVDRGVLGNPGAQERADILVPMLKAWGTDMGCEVASLGLQIHGGMGFIEETGVAQLYRDARIAPIYEGTNGIQAADLVIRKLGYRGGAGLIDLFEEILADAANEGGLFSLTGNCLEVAQWMLREATLDDRLAGSVPFCTMCSVAVAGWQLLTQVRSLDGENRDFAVRKMATAKFFLECLTYEVAGLKKSAMGGSASLYAIETALLV